MRSAPGHKSAKALSRPAYARSAAGGRTCRIADRFRAKPNADSDYARRLCLVAAAAEGVSDGHSRPHHPATAEFHIVVDYV